MHYIYKCIDCGHTIDTNEITYTCPKCTGSEKEGEFRKGNLMVEYDKKDLEALKTKPNLSFYDFFPYKAVTPFTYPVGNTPVCSPTRLQKETGLKNLICKLDSQLPSGSFKDRASQLIAFQALAHNTDTIALASTGNAGAAMSCAGAAYGLNIVLFVPETAPLNKLMQSVLYGATVVPVKGTYDDAFALSLVYTENFGGINRNTAYNPMTIEGKKSVSIELFLQLGRKAPDVVYVPVGDGCIIAGVYKGFYDLVKGGFLDKMPKIVCAQSKQSMAISRAWKDGNYSNFNATTRADSISVSSPANGRMAVNNVKDSEGWCTVVDDSEILEAQMKLLKAGMFVEPAAACSYAALDKDKEMLKEKFGEDVNVCVLLTGTGFKDMAVFDGRVELPQAIENSKEAVIERFSK